MYSRSPNRDELEVGKKVETDDCCIRNQVVGGRLGGTCGTLGRAQSSSSTPPRFPMPPHYAAGKWGMRDRAEVKDGRLLPPVCTAAQGSDSEHLQCGPKLQGPQLGIHLASEKNLTYDDGFRPANLGNCPRTTQPRPRATPPSTTPPI